MKRSGFLNFFSIFGISVILSAIFFSAFAYIIAPDSSPSANSQILEIRTRKPGYSCSFLKVRLNETPEKTSFFGRFIAGTPDTSLLVPFQSFVFASDSIIITGLENSPAEKPIKQAFQLVEVIYPISENQKFLPDQTCFDFLTNQKRPVHICKADLQRTILEKHIIRKSFWLGTDMFGRDLLSRLLIGLRISLAVGFIAVFISLLLGISLGSIAGYFGGFTDKLITWFINVVWSIPTLLLVIAITLALGRGFWQVFLAVGLSMWVEVARMVRGQVMVLKEKEFIEATRALGFSHLRILWKHVIPNIINPVIVISAANFASAILMEAGLSFLGIGVQPPTPSLGSMIKDHYGFIIVDKAYLAIIPGIILMMLVLAFTLVGDGLRDYLDVRKKGQEI